MQHIAAPCHAGPARMADGRLFTDYRPRIDVHLLPHRQQEGEPAHATRQHMIGAGEELISLQRELAYKGALQGPCAQPFEVGTMLPERDHVICDQSGCKRATGSPGGLGTGRVYGALPSQHAAQQVMLARAASAAEQVGQACRPGGFLNQRYVPEPVHDL